MNHCAFCAQEDTCPDADTKQWCEKYSKKIVSTVCCPFCGECDFDLIGLKMHLIVFGCKVFDNTKVHGEG